ncbi:hypothetical protein [Helicobacter sp. MIT 03-1614]|uniref:hypothetical protein n=1 Tax=Helicobacter sp. MIT 03-1614 TaxID=1548147 RepID=UPI0010FDB1B8|nr:hypothetical protein [Helicobacter sp. MIT 03-1614]
MKSEIRESLIAKRVEDSQYSSHFLARIWRDITRDYEGNVLSGVSRYFPVVTEIAFLLLYLMIFVLGVLEILDYLPLNKNKEADEPKIENLGIQKILSIKNILKFFMFGFALLALYLVAILLTHSGLLAQRIIGYIGIISIPVYLVGYGMHLVTKRKLKM